MKINGNVRGATFVIDGHRVYVEVDMHRMAKLMLRRSLRNKSRSATACLGAAEGKIVPPEKEGG